MPAGKPVRKISSYLECAGGQIPYEVIFSNRKTLSIQVTNTGQVQVKAPAALPISQVQEFVNKHRVWIEEHLHAVQQKLANRIVMTEAEIQAQMELARQVFKQKTAYWAGIMGVTYEKITIRSQAARWGSCSSKGNLSFNWRITLMPPEIQDYVVVHELAHRMEMNHSERFWNQVKKYLPDYKNYRKWLRCHGGEYEVFSEY